MSAQDRLDTLVAAHHDALYQADLYEMAESGDEVYDRVRATTGSDREARRELKLKVRVTAT
jgi:hypothetical protein